MKKNICLAAVFLTAGFVLAQTQTTYRIDQKDRKNLSLTLYPNIAFVRDVFAIFPPQGEGAMTANNFPREAMYESVFLNASSAGGKFRLLSSRITGEDVSERAALSRYIGKKIQVGMQTDSGNTVIKDAVLIDPDRFIFKVDDKVYVGYRGYFILPDDGVIFTGPQIVWNYKNSFNKPFNAELNYLTNGLSWNAEYTLFVGDKNIRIICWANITNNTEVSYKNADIALVAGDAKMRPSAPKMMMREMAMSADAEYGSAPANASRENFYDYHLYRVEGKADILAKERQKLSLFEIDGVKYDKIFIARDSSPVHYNSGERERKIPVQSGVSIKNVKENGAGKVFPAGLARAYAQDAKGEVRPIGSADIANTPVGVDMKLMFGSAFDIEVKAIQTDIKNIDAKKYEASWKVKINNRKKEAVTVQVERNHYGKWTLAKSSMPYKKKDAYTIVFDIPVPAESEATVDYTLKNFNY